MKTMQGASWAASWNSCLSLASDSPTQHTAHEPPYTLPAYRLPEMCNENHASGLVNKAGVAVPCMTPAGYVAWKTSNVDHAASSQAYQTCQKQSQGQTLGGRGPRSGWQWHWPGQSCHSRGAHAAAPPWEAPPPAMHKPDAQQQQKSQPTKVLLMYNSLCIQFDCIVNCTDGHRTYLKKMSYVLLYKLYDALLHSNSVAL